MPDAGTLIAYAVLMIAVATVVLVVMFVDPSSATWKGWAAVGSALVWALAALLAADRVNPDDSASNG